jgi:hypothetical protein
MTNLKDPESLIKNRFSEANILIRSIDRRDYPEESIFLIFVDQDQFSDASLIGNEIDHELAERGFDGFVTVRGIKHEDIKASAGAKLGVADSRTPELINLMTSRSRTSEIQPSLSYIPDAGKNIYTALTGRHHLIFGRRGAGKTALMVEAKKLVEEKGQLSIWVNLQTYRHESADRTFLWICQRICELVQTYFARVQKAPHVLATATRTNDDIQMLIASESLSDKGITRLIPSIQTIIRRFLETTGTSLYIFLDDLHYIDSKEQPILLDMVHGSVRDCSAWLKVTGIRHLMRWFQAKPAMGLQSGHDADHIDLDVTLENPSEAKVFLERVIGSYAKHVGISSPSNIISKKALDRLVLASGAVPRDYLVLSAAGIRQAQMRENARLVGVQDVNRAAGKAAKVKISELEDDAASIEGTTSEIIRGLQIIRNFCIDEKNCTFFRIDFHDKENNVSEYDILQDLLDLRLVHLVDQSLSDERKAGRRSEVYMLDLSQFSGQRLKRRLRVLDFESGNLVLKETGTKAEKKIGTTSRKRQGILRRGPLFELSHLSLCND